MRSVFSRSCGSDDNMQNHEKTKGFRLMDHSILRENYFFIYPTISIRNPNSDNLSPFRAASADSSYFNMSWYFIFCYTNPKNMWISIIRSLISIPKFWKSFLWKSEITLLVPVWTMLNLPGNLAYSDGSLSWFHFSK